MPVDSVIPCCLTRHHPGPVVSRKVGKLFVVNGRQRIRTESWKKRKTRHTTIAAVSTRVKKKRAELLRFLCMHVQKVGLPASAYKRRCISTRDAWRRGMPGSVRVGRITKKENHLRIPPPAKKFALLYMHALGESSICKQTSIRTVALRMSAACVHCRASTAVPG